MAGMQHSEALHGVLLRHVIGNCMQRMTACAMFSQFNEQMNDSKTGLQGESDTNVLNPIVSSTSERQFFPPPNLVDKFFLVDTSTW